MWEITLRGKPSDILHFLELKNKIKKILNKNALVVITFDSDLVCSIAVVKDRKFNKIISLIYETIIKIVKIEYLNDNLKVFSNDKSLNSYLVCSIINSSILDEIKYAMKITTLSKNIVIRSFVQFKLHAIYNLWLNEVEYYNYHFAQSNEKGYLNFLKFIALNIHTKSDILYLEKINSEMFLLDRNRNKMKKFDINDDIGLIANLIMYAPKKLIISSFDSLSTKVTNLISYIFEDRVSLIL